MKRSYLIVDGQWGSTGKGLICGYLALKREPDTAVCNFGSNAGHTVVLDNGDSIMTQMLPSAIVSPSVRKILIGPGAIIDPEIFNKEMVKFADLMAGKEVYIHESAAIISQKHKDIEGVLLNRISSTCKGVGAAQADKVMRNPDAIARNNKGLITNNNVHVVDVMEFTRLIKNSDNLQIESAQGMELGVNSGGFYPFCTSRDITVHQVLSDCGIPYGIYPEIIVTMRTFPIRVGNAFDKDGNQIGTSGPVYLDQKELTWEELGVDSERTTVTNKVRRVFTWSEENFKKVIELLSPDAIFLNFVNYLEPNPTFYSRKTQAFIDSVEWMEEHHNIIRYIGAGPKVSDVMERF